MLFAIVHMQITSITVQAFFAFLFLTLVSLIDFFPQRASRVESKQDSSLLFLLMCISQDKPLTSCGKWTVSYL